MVGVVTEEDDDGKEALNPANLVCRTVAAMSWVSLVVIDCTRIGLDPPTPTEPTFTSTVRRRRVWKRDRQ